MTGDAAPGRPARLVLLGGGHAHLAVLHSLRSEPWPEVEVVVVSPGEHEFYSGMVPGYLQGTYEAPELTLPVARLTAAAGARFVAARATRIDGPGRRVHTPDEALEFDYLSLNVGSVPGGLDRPGVRAHAYALRPLDRSRELRSRVDELGRSERTPRVVVAGAGAGGVEVALAIERRIRDHGGSCRITVVDRGDDLLPGYARRTRALAGRILRGRGITLHLGDEAVSVHDDGLRLGSGLDLSAELVVWSTGAHPPPLFETSRLPLSERGYLRVGPTLRATDGSPIWGAGDCVDLVGRDVPKAGVYAVRQGPVLARNLRAAIAGRHETEYEPQGSFLSILNTADGRALLRWKGLVSHSRPAWWLKDWIDRRFMRRYRSPE